MATKKTKFILYSLLPKIKQYLNLDTILIHLLSTYAITPDEDYNTITKLRQENATRGQICIEIVRIIDQRHTLDEFITALENSKLEDRGHEEIVKIIIEEQEKRAACPTPEETHQIRKTSDSIPNLMPKLEINESAFPNDDDEPEAPYFSPRVRTTSGASNTTPSRDNSLVIPIDEPARREVGDGDPDQTLNPDEEDTPSISSFCLGSLCAGLFVIVLILAGGGIALIYYAILGFMGDDRTACHIPSDPNAPDSDVENLEVSSIYAFNFISGFLCLTIPVIFVLLLILGICNEFKNNIFNRPYVRRCLVVLIIIYIAICIVIGVGELALSFYVASVVYPNFKNFMETLNNGTATAQPFTTVDPNQLLCRPTVYISAFACLTVLYLLVFIVLTVIVGVLVTKHIVKSYHKVINDYIGICLRAFQPGPNNGTVLTAARPLLDGNEGIRNRGPSLETTV